VKIGGTVKECYWNANEEENNYHACKMMSQGQGQGRKSEMYPHKPDSSQGVHLFLVENILNRNNDLAHVK
jgi:hypothetical protein